MNGKQKKWLIGIFISIIVAVVGISFALAIKRITGVKDYVVLADGLQLIFGELDDAYDTIRGDVRIPLTDLQAKANEAYTFSLQNTNIVPLRYTIYLDDSETNTLPTSALRFNLMEKSTGVDITKNLNEVSETSPRRLYSTSLKAGKKHDYELRIYLGVQAENDVQGKRYSAKIRIEVNEEIPPYYEEILNGCDPILTDDLTPVRIQSDGRVIKADILEEWYSYEKQEWANAVVLEDGAQEYQAGEVIAEDDIESYFVWIPKYEYRLFDMGDYSKLSALEVKPQTIEIRFTPYSIALDDWGSGFGGLEVGDYMTHPAFEDFGSTGFWVGKFETGYRGATTTAAAQVNSNDHSKIIIKPDKFSWRNITVGNAFKASYEYLRDAESHMMKNTEWGAVAYLQHSIYGSRKSVRVNNNNAYKTGYAALIDPTCGYNTDGASSACNLVGSNATYTLPYNTSVGYNASTTNNISGVYDMSGGTREYVMGYNTKATTVGGGSAITTHYPNFFTSSEWDKYYDKYESTSVTVYTNRILGDATGEMGPFANITDPDTNARTRSSWYNDYANGLEPSYPWYIRGYQINTGTASGIFAFQRGNGSASNATGFRIVLTP